TAAVILTHSLNFHVKQLPFGQLLTAPHSLAPGLYDRSFNSANLPTRARSGQEPFGAALDSPPVHYNPFQHFPAAYRNAGGMGCLACGHSRSSRRTGRALSSSWAASRRCPPRSPDGRGLVGGHPFGWLLVAPQLVAVEVVLGRQLAGP